MPHFFENVWFVALLVIIHKPGKLIGAISDENCLAIDEHEEGAGENEHRDGDAVEERA